MLSPFRVALLIFFGLLIIGGTLMFAGIIPGWKQRTSSQRANVTIWGTVPSYQFNQLIRKFNEDYNGSYFLKYSEVPEKDLRVNLLEAADSSSPPDLIFFPHERLISVSDKLLPIPAASFSSREFKDTFIETGEIFMGQQGVYAMPFAIDPLVLYWNRDILRSKGKTSPPSSWQEVYDMSAAITEKDSVGNIGKGLLTIAMGETQNVKWFKDILSLVFLETGDRIVEVGNNGELTPSLGFAGSSDSKIASNASKAVSFYVDFASPTARHYTWTGAMPSSLDAFIAEKLALYIGRASDYRIILDKNPHLNFDVAQVPQFNNEPLTYGSVFGMGVVRKSKNQAASYGVLSLLKDKKYAKILADNLFLPPARKDLLSEKQEDSFYETFYDAAKMSDNWLDPDPEKTEEIFGFLVKGVASGRTLPTPAVQAAVSNLRDVLQEINQKNKNVQEI